MYLTENEKNEHNIQNCVSQTADPPYIIHARQLRE